MDGYNHEIQCIKVNAQHHPSRDCLIKEYGSNHMVAKSCNSKKLQAQMQFSSLGILKR